MLKRENYTSEHIDALRKQTGADPSILERTVFAFGLLEALCRVKMPFIFKGGTSLLILLDEPRRLSTDGYRHHRCAWHRCGWLHSASRSDISFS